MHFLQKNFIITCLVHMILLIINLKLGLGVAARSCVRSIQSSQLCMPSSILDVTACRTFDYHTNMYSVNMLSWIYCYITSQSHHFFPRFFCICPGQGWALLVVFECKYAKNCKKLVANCVGLKMIISIK